MLLHACMVHAVDERAVPCCRSLYSSIVGLRPMAFLSFELPPGTFDINVTPDKRSVFVQREVAVVNALQQVGAVVVRIVNLLAC